MKFLFQLPVSGSPFLRPFPLRLLPVLGVAMLPSVGSLAAATLTWDAGNPPVPSTGSDGSGVWDTKTTADFTNGTTDVTYTNNSSAFFGSNGTAGTVTLSTTETVATLKMNPVSGTTGYTFSQQGTGTGGAIAATTLESNAPGTLTTINVPLTASSVLFYQAGTITLSGGSAKFGADSTSTTSAGVTTNNLSPNIQGEAGGGLTAVKNGAASAVVLTAGTYTIGTSIAIGNVAAGTSGVQVNAGATLIASTVAASTTTNAAGTIITTEPLNDLGVGGYGANGTGLLTINGGTVQQSSASHYIYIENNVSPITGAALTTANLSGRLIVNSGVLSTAGQIIVGNRFGAGTQSAELDVNGGTVFLSNAGGSEAGGILLNYSGTAAAGGTSTINLTGGATTLGTYSGIIFNAASSTIGSSTLNVSGGGLFLGGGGLINGSSNTGSATLSVNFSGGTVGAVSDWATSVPITLPAGGNVTFQTSNLGASNAAAASPTTTPYTAATASLFAITLNGALSGAGGFTASGGGTLTLNAANLYTGATTVNGGTLLVNGSIGSSATPSGAVTVNSGGTLLVSGSIGSTATPGGAVTVNGGGTLGGTGLLGVASATVAGTLAPGAAPGATSGSLTLNTTGGLTLTGTLLVGAAGGGASTVLNTNGTLTLSGATLALSGTLDGTSNYEVASYGALSGTFAAVTGVPSGYTLTYNGTGFGAADIELDVAATPVPEPTAGTALLLGLALLARSRRWLPGVHAVAA